MKRILLLSTALLMGFQTSHAASISSSFSKAKKKLYKQVYGNQGFTSYTNCAWSKKKVDLSSCGLENSFPKKYMKRAKRIEAEHIIPASWMYKKNGKFRQCYLDAKAKETSPRKYCQKHDHEYRNAHNDLMNLRPVIGQINGERSNKPFSETLSGKKQKTYVGDGKTVMISSRVIVPDSNIRGDIARIAFYMQRQYGVTYSKRQLSLFKKWDKDDPISQKEMFLNQEIRKVQRMIPL